MVAAGKIIPAEMIVRMLRKIIYSGDGRKYFILSSFPDIIEQAREFEKSCANFAAILYTTNADPVIEIKNNNLTLFNIDSLFMKEFRLKPVSGLNALTIREDYEGISVDYCVVVGPPQSGKSTVCKLLEKHCGFIVINWQDWKDRIKKSLSTDEEPWEGEVSAQ